MRIAESVSAEHHSRRRSPFSLYRHFPTRDVLLEAVYRTEVARSAAAEKEFSTTMPPGRGIEGGDVAVCRLHRAEQLIAPALNTVVGVTSNLFESSGAQIKEAVHSLVRRAIDSGDIRSDLDPLDLLRALVGVSNVASAPDWPESARRLVHILIAGSRPAA
jgi:AcrR family transcriptional regulator